MKTDMLKLNIDQSNLYMFIKVTNFSESLAFIKSSQLLSRCIILEINENLVHYHALCIIQVTILPLLARLWYHIKFSYNQGCI